MTAITKQSLPLISLGKYKEQSITTLMNDTEYLECCKQPELFQKFQIVYDICGNQTITMEKNITLDELIDDINKSSFDEYTFLKILNNNNDRVIFLSKVSDKHYNEIFMTKKIKLSLWLYVMGLIKSRLSINYILYRKAYFGENIGKRRITQQLTNFVVPLWHFETKIKKETFIQQIIQYYMDNRPVKRILLYDNKMENFEFKTSKYIFSSWYNYKYEFKNDLF